MPFFKPIPGETPLTDISELKVKGISLQRELNRVEAINIAKALGRYFDEEAAPSGRRSHCSSRQAGCITKPSTSTRSRTVTAAGRGLWQMSGSACTTTP